MGGSEYTCVSRSQGAVILPHAGNDAGPRLRRAADILNEQHLDTLLLDLQRPRVQAGARRADDAGQPARRLLQGLVWLQGRPSTAGRAVGVFAITAAAVTAIELAARHPERVAALVACSASIEPLGAPVLQAVNAPTLLIVGGLDTDLVKTSRHSLHLLQCARRLEVIPRTDGRFAAPGSLEAAAHLGAHWLAQHLGRPAWM